MNLFLIIYLLFLAKEIISKSDAYYNCINPNNTVVASPSYCSSISIPDSDGYKCCSMKISNKDEYAYNCFPIENKYLQSQELFKEFILQRSLSPLFTASGGSMEIECENMTLDTEYQKLSQQHLNCNEGNLNGVKGEDECINNDIPTNEGGKCCYIETFKRYDKKSFIKDKRCYVIKNEYFSNKNFSDYLLDESEKDSLDKIRNVNITIKCKNYETYFFQGEFDNFDEEKKSGLSGGVIALIIIVCIVFAIGIGFIIIRSKNKSLNLKLKSTFL